MLQRVFLWTLVAGFFSVQACNTPESGEVAANEATDETAIAEAPTQDLPEVELDPANLPDGLYAQFSTSMGEIYIRLEFDKVPMTVGNFVALAEGKMPNSGKELGTPFFDGTIFHRVIPNFMIQGGDPQGTGMGGPNYKFGDEFHPELRHSGAGILSMANSGPGTNGSQFFITHNATPHLDNRHSVFGKVVSGQDVVVAIGNTPRGAQDRPNADVVLKKVTIIRKGAAAEGFDGLAAFNAVQEKAKKEAEEQAKAAEAALAKYKKVGKTTESGLIYIVEKKGNGPKPLESQTVLMNYAGYFMDGKLFDTSIKEIAEKNGVFDPNRPYEPFPVTYGSQARVIEGWKEAMKLMRVGTKLKVIIPPNLAYGDRQMGPIPANSTLIFDMEMVKIQE